MKPRLFATLAVAALLCSCFDLSMYVGKDASNNVVSDFRFTISSASMDLSREAGEEYGDPMNEMRGSLEDFEESLSDKGDFPSFVKVEATSIDDGVDYGFGFRFTYPLAKASSLPERVPLVPRVGTNSITVYLPVGDMEDSLAANGADQDSIAMVFSSTRIRFYVGASLAAKVTSVAITPEGPWGEPTFRQYRDFAIVEVPLAAWLMATDGLMVTIGTGK